jgi:hypothetical protein
MLQGAICALSQGGGFWALSLVEPLSCAVLCCRKGMCLFTSYLMPLCSFILTWGKNMQ